MPFKYIPIGDDGVSELKLFICSIYWKILVEVTKTQNGNFLITNLCSFASSHSIDTYSIFRSGL